MNLQFHVSNNFFLFTCLWERGWRLRCTHTMHSLTCVSAFVCVVRKPRPCLSYSRRRDRINLVFLRSYYKGGGGYTCRPVVLADKARLHKNISDQTMLSV